MIRARPVRALAAIAALAVVLAAAGCSDDRGAGAATTPDADPVALATLYGTAAATCDMESARIASSFGAGWTAYAPGTPDPAYERRAEQRAREALAACRRDVEQGSTVEATPVSDDGDRAVVLVRTTGPSGRSREVRMTFANLAALGDGRDDQWVRVE